VSDLPEEVRDYLDALKESGAINMFQAGTYLQSEFGVNRYVAKEYTLAWMKEQ